MRTNLQQFVYWATRVDRNDLLELYELLNRIEQENSRIPPPPNTDLSICIENWVDSIIHPKTPSNSPPNSPQYDTYDLINGSQSNSDIVIGPHTLSEYDSEAEDHDKP